MLERHRWAVAVASVAFGMFMLRLPQPARALGEGALAFAVPAFYFGTTMRRLMSGPGWFGATACLVLTDWTLTASAVIAMGGGYSNASEIVTLSVVVALAVGAYALLHPLHHGPRAAQEES